MESDLTADLRARARWASICQQLLVLQNDMRIARGLAGERATNRLGFQIGQAAEYLRALPELVEAVRRKSAQLPSAVN